MAVSGKSAFELILKSNQSITKEVVFAPPRRFRFDFADTGRKLAFEYEGIMSKKARHTSVTGYTKDCEKYNLAALNGWRVFRFTALNVKDLPDLLKTLYL